MKAYYYSLMVDLWGDVPYSQAFKGDAGIKEAAYDADDVIYADLFALIDKALVNFDLTSPVAVRGDLIYNGVIAKWKKAAKSLKLRLLLQTSKVNPNAKAEIEAVIAAGDSDYQCCR